MKWVAETGFFRKTRFLAHLLKTGYRGFVSGEFMPLPDANTPAERGIAYLRQIQEQLTWRMENGEMRNEQRREPGSLSTLEGGD